MTDMVELKKRKDPLNLAVVYVDPDAFIANLPGWLEITAFISAQRLGEAQVPADGVTPRLSTEQLRKAGVHDVGNDAIFAFCMTAAMKGDKAAVDKVEQALVASMGKEFPGSVGLWHFRAQIDAPTTLEDFVGQAGKKMLVGDIPPPPLRAKENWSTGLRFFEKARKSNFVHEVMYRLLVEDNGVGMPLAKWTRERWTETLDKGIAFLAHIEDKRTGAARGAGGEAQRSALYRQHAAAARARRRYGAQRGISGLPALPVAPQLAGATRRASLQRVSDN